MIKKSFILALTLLMSGCFSSQSRQPSEDFIQESLDTYAGQALEMVRWRPGENLSNQTFFETIKWRRGKGSLKSQDLYVIELYGTMQFTMDYGEYVFTKEGEEGENSYWARRSFGKFSKGDVIQKTGELQFRRSDDGWEVVEIKPDVIPKQIVNIRS
ncbi:hypothetical protein [Marinobacter sp.]|uniref:hypothetical protein n=1 Tax=Marinobacter sp. TaxID=50741 RepID=UPI003568E6C3